MRLWHDDIRRPPDDSWEWARTNDDAKRLLETGDVTEISLDHDLGLHGADPDVPDADLQCLPEGMRPEEGWELVRWMVLLDLVPPRVTIHSHNPAGAKRMADILRDNGYACTVRPFFRADEVPA